MNIVNISELDFIFISYDEPNAEENWKDLCDKIPWAKRVHGVKGSDAAHKAAANLSKTDRFVVVDADNVISDSFVNQVIELDDSIDAKNVVLSWPSLNIINGLLYGNGGIKCWPKDLALTMKTHESADPLNLRSQIDFCWDIEYIPIEQSYSTTINNVTPLQAWRAGFREGVKMSLDQGGRANKLSELYSGNLRRLAIWMTVGADVGNGLWAILGARQGCFMTHFTNWDYVQVRDFEFLNKLWKDTTETMSEDSIYKEITRLGNIINKEITLPEPLAADQSRFFKEFNFNPDRQPKTVKASHNDKEYDIVMITYGESNADKNWEMLKQRFPRAIRVDGVKGIHDAHKVAASKVRTNMFWVVDGDAVISNNFEFDFISPKHKENSVYVWRAKNPVNDLVYGYGGVKLLPTNRTLNMDFSKPDMTTSIGNSYRPVFEISNITEFNTSAFNAWRSAFRECCKLSSKIIDRQVDRETIERLNVWCTIGSDRPFGIDTIHGAIAGRKYGEEHRDNMDALKKINDFDWLWGKFNGI